MIRLGLSEFFLDLDGRGWWLLQVMRERGKQRGLTRHGPFTSPRHVLQQRVVELPAEALRDLVEFVEAVGGGDALLDEVPRASGAPESAGGDLA